MLALISPQEYIGTLTGGAYKAVPTAGTRVQLVTVETNVTGIIVQATEDNAGYIAVGGSDVVAAKGATRVCVQMLAAGGAVLVPVRDLRLVYIDATSGGDSVNYFPIVG